MKKSRITWTLGIVAGFLLPPSAAQAEYCATGNIEAQVCSGFFIESCSFSQVDAVKGDNGKLHTIKQCYNSVSDYSESKGRCWIRIKSDGAGLISWGVNAATQPEFFRKDGDGSYEELDVESLTFKCRRR